MLVVVCGWPMAGKSTVARELSRKLGIHHVDIDDNIRFPIFGTPHPHPNSSPELMQKDREEIASSYELLMNAVDVYLRLSRSLIITATFSRKIGQEKLKAVCDRYPNSELKVVQCLPKNDDDEEIQKRLSDRVFGKNCFSSVNSSERYNEVKNRFEPILLPHLKIDTTKPFAFCIKEALEYLV